MSLPRDKELQLLDKLSSDDAYRSRFEKDPSGALQEAGFSKEDIGSIPPGSLKAGKLADKSSIADARSKLASQNTSDHVCLVVPMLRIS